MKTQMATIKIYRGIDVVDDVTDTDGSYDVLLLISFTGSYAKRMGPSKPPVLDMRGIACHPTVWSCRCREALACSDYPTIGAR